MSKFIESSSFFKRNSTQQLNITIKSFQKKSNKNKKNDNNLISNVSDNDFNKLMKENKNSKSINKTEIKLSSYLDKIEESEITFRLVQENIKGKDFINKIKYENISGTQLLNAIFKKYYKPTDLDWIKKDEYSEALINLLKNNFQEQLLCLLIIQNHSIKMNMPKINYKDKDVYYIKLIFQLMFTQDIIDESVYWKWYELFSTFTDVNEDIINKLFIQTTEFFNILKMTFTDEDYENNENNKEKIEIKKEPKAYSGLPSLMVLSFNDNTTKSFEPVNKYKNQEDKEDQDWNMDDI